jgi:hypothetical protein
MVATLAAGSAAAFFVVALILLSLNDFDRGAAQAALVGLIALSLSVALVAGDRRPRA